MSVHCSNGLFDVMERECVFAKSKLHVAREPKERARWAGELARAIDKLLGCEDYQDACTDCSVCHDYAQMVRRAGMLVAGASMLRHSRTVRERSR